MTIEEARQIVINKCDDGNLADVRHLNSLSDGTHIFKGLLKHPEEDPLGNINTEFTIWVNKRGQTLVEPE